jgi:hypothetical protein
MDSHDIVRRRLAGQYLTGRRAPRASEVVRTLGAVQAQDYADAKWALGQRTVGAVDDDVEGELSDGRILRTHVLRPTWHFVTADDIRWMLALTGPRVKASAASRNRQQGLDAEVLRRSNDVLIRALEGSNHLTRPELAERLQHAGIETRTENRLAHIMMHAELDAIVCSGPRRGNKFTYALLEERVRRVPAIDRDEALLRLARCYFATRGPATIRDCAWWSGLTMSDIKRGIEAADNELEMVTIDSTRYWYAPSARHLPAEAKSAHLLTSYDEYFIGLRDRSAIARHVARPTSEPIIGHYAFIDGQIVARWSRTRVASTVIVELQPLTRITRAELGRIAEQADRFGEFFGLTAEVRA